MRGDTEEAKRDAGATNAMLIAAETISMMITFGYKWSCLLILLTVVEYLHLPSSLLGWRQLAVVLNCEVRL